MAQELEYLLLKDKGPYHEVYVRRPLNPDRGSCRFYAIVITIIAVCLVLLVSSLVYVFVLIPSASWQGEVLNWDGRKYQEARTHVLTHTHCGPIEGSIEDGVYVFKGIPYAQPPTGKLRWARPLPFTTADRTCWTVTRQTKKFGSQCVQPRTFGDFASPPSGSEDCLFLNVWTQSLDPIAGLPVMVWIHGGDLVYGSGHAPAWSPTGEAATATRTVYVSLNYRLGPFGFLALDELAHGSSTGTSGNYGLMDVIVALQWVRDNIKNFGGNPNKVTVFGQSSGGTLVQALLASPLARGLFQRAWLSSPSAVLNKTSSQASVENRVFLNLADCKDAACLRGLSAQQVMSATPWNVFPYWAMDDLFGMPIKGRFDGALLVVDGYVLPEPPLRAWNYGRGNDVPLLFTTMAQEVDLQPFDPTIYNWTWAHYAEVVKTQLTPYSPDIATAALQLYPANDFFSPEYQYTSMVSDIRTTCPVSALANVTSSHFLSPVYRAVVTDAPSSPVNITGALSRYAFHGWDLLVFFGDFASFHYQPSARDLAFQKVLREQVASFARDGHPGAPVWDTVRTCVALLSDHVFPVEQYNRNRCDFWFKNGFYSYAWIN